MQKRRKAIKGNQIIYSLSTVKDFGFLLKGYVGSSNPLEYSCLENPVDRGAWWAAIHRVTQSWTRLKRCSSSKGCKQYSEPYPMSCFIDTEAPPGGVNSTMTRL